MTFILPNTLISVGLLRDTCKTLKLKVRNYSGPRADGRIILEWIREKEQHVAVCTGLICSRELVTKKR